jgi:hypothetical protein
MSATLDSTRRDTHPPTGDRSGGDAPLTVSRRDDQRSAQRRSLILLVTFRLEPNKGIGALPQ